MKFVLAAILACGMFVGTTEAAHCCGHRAGSRVVKVVRQPVQKIVRGVRKLGTCLRGVCR